MKSHKFGNEALKKMKIQTENNPVTVKATFHMESGDVTLTFVCSKVNFPHFRFEKGTT